MMLDCYDFDTGQPRHFPAGTYREQVATATGRTELELMRLLRRCWLVFQQRSIDKWDMADMAFVDWLAAKRPIDDSNLNRVIKHRWQQQAA